MASCPVSKQPCPRLDCDPEHGECIAQSRPDTRFTAAAGITAAKLLRTIREDARSLVIQRARDHIANVRGQVSKDHWRVQELRWLIDALAILDAWESSKR